MTQILLSLAAVLLLTAPASAARPQPAPTEPLLKSVCIDPGHGGSEPGTSRAPFVEKDVNLDVSNRLTALLRSNGYTVHQTRTTDATLSNSDRYNYCNATDATTLVSIHHNGSTSPSANYSLALYAKNSDKELATSIVNHVSSGLGLTNNGISRFMSGVLLKSDVPATISEAFFLTSDYEYNLLTLDYDGRINQEVDSLHAGIANYYLTR